jgi:hypothetical protein
VVDAVHARRDDDHRQPPFCVDRQCEVAVMKQDRQEQRLLVHVKCLAVDAKQQRLRRAEPRGQRQLAEMEPDARRAVEIAIEVM